jgi:hypothetical protein
LGEGKVLAVGGGWGFEGSACQSQIALGSIPCWDWTGMLLTPEGACLVFSLTKGVHKPPDSTDTFAATSCTF